MIYAFTGGNTYQIQEKLRDLKKSFTAKHGEDGVESYLGEEITPDTLQNILGGLSLFASHRLVVIRYLSENKPIVEQFSKKIEQVPDETTIVLIEGVVDKRTAYYKALKKLPQFYEFKEPSEPALKDWVNKFVANEKAKISPDALRVLLMATGADQARIAHELDKLTAYSSEITAEMVHELVEMRPQESVFALLDAALNGEHQKTQKLLANLERAHEDPYEIIGMLIWQVHILAIVASADGVPEGEIAKKAKVNPYVVQKTATLARRLSKRKIKDIIDAAVQLDVAQKTGSAQPWSLLAQAMLRM